MSSADVVGADKAPPPPLEEEELPGGLRGVRERTWLNVRTGNLGAIPIIVGELAVVVFFAFTATNFFTSVNFVNLITETAGTALLAYGVVFVLLLGEIDLSIGYLAGISAVIVAELALPGRSLQMNGLLAMLIAVAVCAADRRSAGLDRRVRRRSLVRRHARRLSDLRGRDPEYAAAARLDRHPGPLDQLHRQLHILARGRVGDRRDLHGSLPAQRGLQEDRRPRHAHRPAELDVSDSEDRRHRRRGVRDRCDLQPRQDHHDARGSAARRRDRDRLLRRS